MEKSLMPLEYVCVCVSVDECAYVFLLSSGGDPRRKLYVCGTFYFTVLCIKKYGEDYQHILSCR